jgi:hypothetical protein
MRAHAEFRMVLQDIDQQSADRFLALDDRICGLNIRCVALGGRLLECCFAIGGRLLERSPGVGLRLLDFFETGGEISLSLRVLPCQEISNAPES